MSALAGTLTLTRLAARRSRAILLAWILVFVGMAGVSASATVDLYPTLASRLGAAESINQSQALVAFFGRIYDPSSLGAISLIKLGGFGAVFVAMLSVVLVVRHTRGDEEAGRTELLGATAMGRYAPLTSALVLVALANLVLAVLTAVWLAAAGLPVDGSIAFGLAWGGVGLALGAITAVTVQLTTSAHTATSLSGAILAFVYVLRAVGDTAAEGGPRWVSWLSPIGWGQQFRPFAGNRWWVLMIILGFTGVVVAGAFALVSRRDLGTGVFPARAGPAAASSRFGTPLALAWRLQRVGFAGWAVGFTVMGAFLGNMASGVGSFISSPEARDFMMKLGGEKALVDAFLAVELSFAGVLAAAYGIHVVTSLRSEEVELRAEPVLATAVSRVRWAASHLVIAFAGTAMLMALIGAAAGLAHGAQMGDLGLATPVLVGALAQIPAAFVLVAIPVAAFGIGPRLTSLGWISLAAFVLLGELGPLLSLNQWFMDLSPFAHSPRLPGAAFSATPILALSGVAALIVVAGIAALRHRDMA